MKILIIDDDPLSLSGIQMALEQRGGHVCTAMQDAEEALEVYRREKFDVVISDVRMPKLSGIDLLRQVKRINPKAIVLLMTGYRTPDLIGAMNEYGDCACFFKPLRADDLLQTLQTLKTHSTR